MINNSRLITAVKENLTTICNSFEIRLCSWNIMFWEHNVYAGYSSVDFPIFES